MLNSNESKPRRQYHKEILKSINLFGAKNFMMLYKQDIKPGRKQPSFPLLLTRQNIINVQQK